MLVEYDTGTKQDLTKFNMTPESQQYFSIKVGRIVVHKFRSIPLLPVDTNCQLFNVTFCHTKSCVFGHFREALE